MMTALPSLLLSRTRRNREGDSEAAIALIERRDRRRFLKELTGLPHWSYLKRVKELADRFAEKDTPSAVPLGVVAGLAIPLQFVVLMMRLGFFPCFAVLIFSAASCESGSPQAVYPWWAWGAVFPVQVACLGLEYICHRYTVVSTYQVLGEFRIFFFGAVSYRMWFAYSVLQSIFASGDMAADSAFLGIFLRSKICAAEDSEEEWHAWIEANHGAAVAAWMPSLTTLVFVGWASVLFEIVWVLLQTIPLIEVDYEIANENEASGYITKYPTVLKREQNHGSALVALAECNNAQLLASTDCHYAKARAQWQYENTRDGDFPMYLHHIEHLLLEGVYLTCMKGLLTNGLQLALQICVLRFRLRKEDEISGNTVMQAYLSFFFSTIGLIARAWGGMTRSRVGWSWLKVGDASIRHLPTDEAARARTLMCKLKLTLAVLVMFAVLSAAFALYCAWKLGVYMLCHKEMWMDFTCARR